MNANDFKTYNLGASNILGQILKMVEESDNIQDFHDLLDVIEGLKSEIDDMIEKNFSPTDALIEQLKEKLKRDREEIKGA
jgi:hypothetical protein